jgi:hypothetical protein
MTEPSTDAGSTIYLAGAPYITADNVSAEGDANDIVARVKRLIPGRWFAYAAPVRDAVLGGIADGASWCFSLIAYARAQSRIATSTGPWLDLIALDYFQRNISRSSGQGDSAFLARIKAELLRERVTRAGMIRAISDLTGSAPVVFEPWNTGDTGAWDNASTLAWDTQGAGAWGDTVFPCQAFLTVLPPGLQGIANAPGWDSAQAGWGSSASELVDQSQISGAVTTQNIYDAINHTKPMGSIMWTQIL